MSTKHEPSLLGSFGLLALRLALGIGLLCHGYDTLFGTNPPVAPATEPTAKIDGFIEHVVKGSLNFPQPGTMGKLAKWTELVGGGLLALGILGRLAALALFGNMAVAVYFHAIVKGDPYFTGSGGGSWEVAALYMAGALCVLCVGSGKLSVDHLLFGGGDDDDEGEAEKPAKAAPAKAAPVPARRPPRG